MPPKTVTCIICGESVLKSQTSFVPKGFSYRLNESETICHTLKEAGRACKTHTGVDEIKEILTETQKAKSQQNNLPPKRSYDPSKDPFNGPLKDPKTTCWTCGKNGTEHQEYMIQNMIAMKELEAEGNIKWILDPSILHNKVKENGVLPPIVLIEVTEKEKDILNYVKEPFKFTAEMIHMVGMCPGCIHNLKMKEALQRQFDKRCETMTPEKIALSTVIMEESGVTDLIKKAAYQNLQMMIYPKQ